MDDSLQWRERGRALIARCGIFDLIRTERVAGDGTAELLRNLLQQAGLLAWTQLWERLLDAVERRHVLHW